MLIAMAGLPGTGKSTLAALLAQRASGIVLNKDDVRARLFPPPVGDYSREQDDICMAAIYQASACILRRCPEQVVILDGRTFLRACQLKEMLALAASVGQEPFIIECVCDDAIARQRLEQQQAEGRHPAGNRTFALYQQRKAEAEPISAGHLVLDTGRLPVEACAERCLAYVGRQGR